MGTLNENFEAFALKHYGVKGMRWGVRSKRGGLLGRRERKLRRR